MTHAQSEQLEWATEQLDAAGVVAGRNDQTDLLRATVLSLMSVLSRAEFDSVDPDGKYNLRAQTLEVFLRLSTGHALPPEADPYDWRPARNFAPSIGQRARIKVDAFQGEQGRQLNGRVGHVVHLRRGVGLMFDTEVEPRGGTFPPGDVEVAM